jgi:hypothetical protein
LNGDEYGLVRNILDARVPKKKSGQEDCVQDTAIQNFHASEVWFRYTPQELGANTDVVHCLLVLSRVDDSSALELYRSLLGVGREPEGKHCAEIPLVGAGARDNPHIAGTKPPQLRRTHKQTFRAFALSGGRNAHRGRLVRTLLV